MCAKYRLWTGLPEASEKLSILVSQPVEMAFPHPNSRYRQAIGWVLIYTWLLWWSIALILSLDGEAINLQARLPKLSKLPLFFWYQRLVSFPWQLNGRV